MSITDILTCDVKSVVEWCEKEYHQPLFCEIETVEDMANISKAMVVLTNQYSYLSSILSYLKMLIRRAKDNKETKLANTLVDKKEAINNALETVKAKYNMLSRQITIRQDILKELNMSM